MTRSGGVQSASSCVHLIVRLLDRGIGIRVDPIIADVSMVSTSVSTWYRARLRMSDNGSAETA